MSVITNTPQSSREDAQNLSLACVVRFDEEVGERQHISCGLSDATDLLHAMHRFAFAWGCGVVVPPPSDLLAAQHNAGSHIAATVWWSRYYNLSSWPHFLRRLPADRLTCTTHKDSAAAATPGWMTDWLSRAHPPRCKLKVLSIPTVSAYVERASLTRHAQQGPHAALLPDHLSTWRHGTAMNVKFDPSKYALRPSEQVLSASGRIKALLGLSHYLGVHLRRGDKLYVGRAFIQARDNSSETWRACTAPAVVVANVRRLQDAMEQQLGRKMDDVFVATDEVESGYLRQLRAELRCFFKRVVLESDVPSALLNVDRYFNFAVMMTVVHDAAGRMDYHPHMRYQVRCSESARCDARA